MTGFTEPPGPAGPHPDAMATVTSWQPCDQHEERLRSEFLELLASRADACSRSCEPGHITASAAVLDAAGDHVLLTLHPRVGRWLQLGGHCESDDATLAEAALREATEESGIQGLILHPEPVHFDIHPITCSLGKPTWHFDVRYVVRAPAGVTPVRSLESDDLRWWPLHALPTGSEELEPLVRLARSHDRRSMRRR